MWYWNSVDIKQKRPSGAYLKHIKTADTSIQQPVVKKKVEFLGHPVWFGTHSYVLSPLEIIRAQIAKEVRVRAYFKILGAVS
jgi:hypothetical protein